MNLDDSNSRELVRRFRDGDSQAAGQIHDRYLRRLIALAQKRLSPQLAPRFDAEDVVQSAYRSFFIRVRGGNFVLQQAGDLWRLLAQIALNKLRSQVEFHTAQRRGINREDHAPDLPAFLVADEPAPEEVVSSIEQLQQIMQRLDATQRTVLQRRLQGDSVEEIAAEIKRSPRTVRRWLEAIREVMAAELDRDSSGAPFSKPAAATSSPPSEIEYEDIPDPSPPTVPLPPGFDPRAPLPYSDFVIEQLVGAGGGGKVYRAFQKSLVRHVAIKALLKKRQTDPVAIDLFINEAALVSRLQHPRIVAAYGLGRFPNGGYFLAMDFVAGIDLQHKLDCGPPPIHEALTLIRQIAAAVDYAHAQQVLHCDLKPSNILLDENGQPHITDFGMALLHTERDSGSADRGTGGTPAYMAPEQFDCRYGSIDPQTDVYGIGGLLYAFLTGHAPHERVSPDETLEQLVTRPVPAAHELRDIPQSLSDLCARCLAPIPANRFRSVTEFLETLRTIEATL